MLAQVMGLLVFLAGFIMVVVSALSTVVPVTTIGDLERALLFIGGVVTLGLGYLMVSGFPSNRR